MDCFRWKTSFEEVELYNDFQHVHKCMEERFDNVCVERLEKEKVCIKVLMYYAVNVVCRYNSGWMGCSELRLLLRVPLRATKHSFPPGAMNLYRLVWEG